jgi:twinfilin-like protein
MSHSSGITVSEELLAAFSNVSRSTNTRFIQVQIQNETKLEKVNEGHVSASDWEKDFDLVPSVLSDNEACYILYRTDEKSSSDSYLFYLLCYVPDKCKVRDKMLYASSRANLKSGLGGNHFIDDIFGSTKNDFNNHGFAAWKQHQEAGAPLTNEEIQHQEDLEQGVFKGGSGTSSAYVHGVAFPVDDDVLGAFKSFTSGSINYIQIAIDPNNERIILSKTGSFPIDEVPAQFPSNEPRFHYYRWSHQHEGSEVHSVVYCYSCPSSPVKLRMLYSTSKANVSTVAESNGINADCKIEITNASEFNETDLTVILHPPKAQQKKTITKPKPTGNRQLIRNKD